METVLEHNGKTSVGKNIRLGLLAAGAAAGVYGISRSVAQRRTRSRERRRFMNWLEPRLQTLGAALGTTSEVMQAIAHEVTSVARMTTCLARASQKVPPAKQDLLEIAIDKRILRMKKKVHRMLDVTERAQANALHDFYRELEAWLLPGLASDPSSTTAE